MVLTSIIRELLLKLVLKVKVIYKIRDLISEVQSISKAQFPQLLDLFLFQFKSQASYLTKCLSAIIPMPLQALKCLLSRFYLVLTCSSLLTIELKHGLIIGWACKCPRFFGSCLWEFLGCAR